MSAQRISKIVKDNGGTVERGCSLYRGRTASFVAPEPRSSASSVEKHAATY